MPTGNAYSSGHLVLSHFGTCECFNVEDQYLLNLSCFWTFEFRTSLGTSVFALNVNKYDCNFLQFCNYFDACTMYYKVVTVLCVL